MNEQMHGSIISLPLDLLYSAQFLCPESISSGRTSAGWGSRRSGKGIGEGSSWSLQGRATQLQWERGAGATCEARGCSRVRRCNDGASMKKQRERHGFEGHLRDIK